MGEGDEDRVASREVKADASAVRETQSVAEARGGMVTSTGETVMFEGDMGLPDETPKEEDGERDDCEMDDDDVVPKWGRMAKGEASRL